MYISPPADRSFCFCPRTVRTLPTGRPPLPAHGHARAVTQPRPAGPPAAPLTQRAEPQPGSAAGRREVVRKEGLCSLVLCVCGSFLFSPLSPLPHQPTLPSPAALPLLCGGCSGRESSQFCSRLRIPLLPLATLWSHRAVVSQTVGRGLVP